MWHSHMSLHARGRFPGDVPSSWMTDQNLSICTSCHQLVSNSRTVSHHRRCRFRANTPDVVLPPTNLSDTSTLPSLEEVFKLHCPTLCFVPARSRPPFARILASNLISVVNDNSEDAWLKLMMLTKCVLPSTKSKEDTSNRHRLTSYVTCGPKTSLAHFGTLPKDVLSQWHMNLTKTKKDKLNQKFPWPGPVYLERLAVYFSLLD